MLPRSPLGIASLWGDQIIRDGGMMDPTLSAGNLGHPLVQSRGAIRFQEPPAKRRDDPRGPARAANSQPIKPRGDKRMALTGLGRGYRQASRTEDSLRRLHIVRIAYSRYTVHSLSGLDVVGSQFKA
jgi:hypothetical protein